MTMLIDRLSRSVYIVAATLVLAACGDNQTQAKTPAKVAVTCVNATSDCRGTVAVPQSWAEPKGAQIEVAYRVVPRRDIGRPRQGTIFGAIGGPSAGLDDGTLGAWEYVLGELLDDHDLLLMDYRGFGQSTPLACSGLGFDDVPGQLDAFAACASGLGARATDFYTANAARDLRAVLDVLAIDKVSLFGQSYGTQFAQSFAARFPERVRTMILDSTVPPEGLKDRSRPMLMARYLAEVCEQTAGCPFTRESLAASLAQTVAMARADVGGLTPLSLAYAVATFSEPVFARELGAALVSYTQDDPSPLGRLAADAARWEALSAPGPFGPLDDMTAAFAYWCAQDAALPYSRTLSRVEREQAYAAWQATEGSALSEPFTFEEFFGFLLLDAKICTTWPAPSAIDLPIMPGTPYPAVPTLFIAGTADETTPVEDAEELVSRYPEARLLVVPRGVHWVTLYSDAPCAAEAARAVIRTNALPATLPDCSASGPGSLRSFPRTLAEVAPIAEVAGATLHQRILLRAVVLTVLDAATRRMAGAEIYGELDQLVGLRAGTADVTVDAAGATTFALADYTFVDGMVLRGTLERDVAGRITGQLDVAVAKMIDPVRIVLEMDPLEAFPDGRSTLTATFADVDVTVTTATWDE